MNEPHFNGDAYQPEFDFVRLSGQIARIRNIMNDEKWRTLSEISVCTGDHEASISAQLRNLRKKRFGGYVIDKRTRGNREKGLFEYRMKNK